MQYRDQPQECILLFISLSGCNTIFPGCSLPKSNQLTIDLSGADTVSAVVCHSNEPETESGCSLSLSLSLLHIFCLSPCIFSDILQQWTYVLFKILIVLNILNISIAITSSHFRGVQWCSKMRRHYIFLS